MGEIYKTIREAGGRLTKIRKGIIEVLLEYGCLMEKSCIIKKLKDRGVKPARSTVYREFQFFTQNNIVKKNVMFGKEYYAIPCDNHDHLICVKCNKIKKINIDNYLQKREKLIAKQNNFKIIRHSLNFYGYCRECSP